MCLVNTFRTVSLLCIFVLGIVCKERFTLYSNCTRQLWFATRFEATEGAVITTYNEDIDDGDVDADDDDNDYSYYHYNYFSIIIPFKCNVVCEENGRSTMEKVKSMAVSRLNGEEHVGGKFNR